MSQLTTRQLRQRNREINSDFSTLYHERFKTTTNVQVMRIYLELATKYQKSVMQIRRVVRGY
jgi:hypothetical protein